MAKKSPYYYTGGVASTALPTSTTSTGGGLSSGLTVAPIVNPYDAMITNAKAGIPTVGAQRTTANQQVSGQIASALGQSKALSAAEQAQYTALANRAAGIAAALGSFGTGYGENVGSAYNKAAQTIGTLGSGLTGAVASDWQAEQAASRAAVDKALGAGVGKVDSYNPGDLQSALQYTGVTMPGSSLADRALSARAMAEYGAMADKAQVATVSDNAIAQARQALNQRTAEQDAIIAKRPDLFQQALTAERANAQTQQTNLTNLVTASQTWLQNNERLRQSKVQANRTWYLQQQKLGMDKADQAQRWRINEIATTHIDPLTGQPTGGWQWTDDTHTTIAPWQAIKQLGITEKSTDASIAQGWKRLGISQQQVDLARDQLDVTKQHYADMYSVAQRTANLKAQAANKPGKFDPKLSAALHRIVDASGNTIVFDKSGNPVPYTAPGKTATPMDTETRAKLQGAIAGYADALFAGHTDPKTGVTDVEKADFPTALQKFITRGYLSGELAPMGLVALASAYGYSPAQVAKAVTKNINPDTNTPFGYVANQPELPKDFYETHGGKKDPRFATGKTWSESVDPVDHYIGASGIAVTKSGAMVGPGGKYL